MVSKCITLHLHLPPLPSAFPQNSKPTQFPIKLTAPHNKSRLLCPQKCSLFTPMACTQSNFDNFEPDPTLTNEDLKPTTANQRTFSWFEMASLWIGLVVGVPSFYLAGSLVDLGMAWWQGIATVVAANVLLLFPLVLSGHPGAKYGISFPVLARSSFGIRGAHIPTLLRALVGCGWYGIETWIGGEREM